MIAGAHRPINAQFIVYIIENMITYAWPNVCVCAIIYSPRIYKPNAKPMMGFRLVKERKFMACDSQLVVSSRSFFFKIK